MQNFFYSIPTKIAFGKGEMSNLPTFVKEFGSKVLLVYGGGSIKRIGLYDEVIKLLRENDITYYDLSGVEPNPKITSVRKGVDICKKEGIEIVIPIGGGSAIDCAKAIAAGYYYEGDPWDLVLDNDLIKEALPIITILTNAATGSEMDVFAVISNEETQDKLELVDDLLFPKYSILDPTYTFSVPKYHTACGTVDIISHVFEVYFNGVPDTYIQDRIMEGILKTCIHYGPIVYENPEDYDARANLMWSATWAINGFIACGKDGPWPIHAIEHQLSAYYDITHGHGLAILIPVWLEYLLSQGETASLVSYGINVWGISKISHAGRLSDPQFKAPLYPYSRAPGETEMTTAEVKKAVDDFARASLIVDEIGGDGVDIKQAHGFLAGDFLHPRNNRSDEYGGSYENRTRFFREIFSKVKVSCSVDFIIGTRISPYEGIPGGCGTADGESVIEDL